MLPRLIASDLDGTLVRTDGTVSDRVRSVLRRATDAGISIVLVTGRPIHSLKHVASAAGLGGIAICSNGAIVYDLDRDETATHLTLGIETARVVVQALRAAVPGVCFAFVRGPQFACEAAYFEIARDEDHAPGFLDAPVLGDAVGLCDPEPTKLIARHAILTADDLLARLHALGLDGFEATHSGAPFVEIHSAGVTKARALEGFCADLGVLAADVLAFGDMPNDLPMLLWAGRGVAVANAHPAVLAAADEVTLSNDEDGVAVVLERLLDAE